MVIQVADMTREIMVIPVAVTEIRAVAIMKVATEILVDMVTQVVATGKTVV